MMAAARSECRQDPISRKPVSNRSDKGWMEFVASIRKNCGQFRQGLSQPCALFTEIWLSMQDCLITSSPGLRHVICLRWPAYMPSPAGLCRAARTDSAIHHGAHSPEPTHCDAS
jgi:hypothetical protein